MSEVLPQIGLVAVLVLLNAAFAGTEMALVSLREGQLQRLESRGARGRALVTLARDPNRFLATIQIGITLAGFLASAAAAVSLAQPIEEPLTDLIGDAAGPVSIVIVTLILSYLTLVFGELAPKRVAMQRAEGWGLLAARPLALLARLTRPVVWLLSISTDLAVRLLGGDPSRTAEEVTEEELRELVASQQTLTEEHRHILTGAFEIAGRTLQEIVQPRREVFSLDADEGCDAALRALALSGHSRAPVVREGNLDDFLGIVHLRDLVVPSGPTVGDVVLAAPAFPETVTVLDALRTMQAGRHQLAVVVNEHGGSEGIITVEDLLEELVGEIYDETDQDILSVHHEPDGAMVLPGRFPVHDLVDIGISIADGPYSTVAGVVLHGLGRIPDAPGDAVVCDGWSLEVTAVDGRAITEVRVRPDPATSPSAEPDDPSS